MSATVPRQASNAHVPGSGTRRTGTPHWNRATGGYFGAGSHPTTAGLVAADWVDAAELRGLSDVAGDGAVRVHPQPLRLAVPGRGSGGGTPPAAGQDQQPDPEEDRRSEQDVCGPEPVVLGSRCAIEQIPRR